MLANMLAINKTLTTIYIAGNPRRHIETKLADNNALGRQFLHAVTQDNLVQIKALLQQGVSIHYQDLQYPITYNTALHVAVAKESYPCIQFLINQGANNKWLNRHYKNAWQVAQDTSISVLVHEIKPQQVPSLKGFCLFKIKQIQTKPDLLPQEQQQSFIEGIANLPEELKFD